MEDILEYSFIYGSREIGAIEKISNNITVTYLYDKTSNFDYNIGKIASVIIYKDRPISQRIDIEMMCKNTDSAIMIVRDFLGRLPYANMINYEELGLITDKEKEITRVLSRRLYDYEHGTFRPKTVNVIAC